MIAGVLLFVVALFVYNSFFKPEADLEVAPATPVGTDLLEISETLSQATLNREIFSSSGYRLLSDFSTAIPQQPLGRKNPFNPIGRD